MDEQQAAARQSFDVRELFFRSRLPIILQAEAAECGVACLAMVAHYFGYRATGAPRISWTPKSLLWTSRGALGIPRL